MAFVVSVHWRAKQDKVDRLIEVIEELTSLSREEPGNRVYQAHRSPMDSLLFYLYEQYLDEAAFQKHTDSEYFMRLVDGEAIPNLLDDHFANFYTTMIDDRGGL